jgi:MoxR-like ATPase
MAKAVVGKQAAVELLLVALLAEGHVLIEDVPGVGKTLIAKALAKSIGGRFTRVQFTPDLLPSDITGFNVFNPRASQFEFKTGPVETNILLADEINRTVPRTQSSLLESMAEGQVTIDGETRMLPRPFFVLATQNPIELEGTFPLPEAQLDRFLLKVNLGYPNRDEEMTIMDQAGSGDPLAALETVTEPETVTRLQGQRRTVHVSDPVKRYIADLVSETRKSPVFSYGASPRGSLSLMRTCQALAFVRERDYVLPDDVKYMAPWVLGHRLILKPEEQLRGHTADGFLSDIINRVPVPADD